MLVPMIRLLTLLVLGLCCGCHGSPDRPANLRAAALLSGVERLHIELQGPDTASYRLGYGTLSDYRTLPAGRYAVRVTDGDRTLLEQTIGLGAGDPFTLLLTGVSQPGQEVNPQSFNHRLHRIVEGSAAVTANAQLPQLLLYTDYFVRVAGRGNLRVTHLLPGRGPVDVELLRHDSSVTTITNLAYPRASERQRYPPGEYTAVVHPAGSPVEEGRFTLRIDSAALTDVLLVPHPDGTAGPGVLTGVSR